MNSTRKGFAPARPRPGAIRPRDRVVGTDVATRVRGRAPCDPPMRACKGRAWAMTRIVTSGRGMSVM
jgi:hypothetical protein